MSEPSAESRFVEAMRGLAAGLRLRGIEMDMQHHVDAVEAFADRDCRISHERECCRQIHVACECHATCRAALLKECGL